MEIEMVTEENGNKRCGSDVSMGNAKRKRLAKPENGLS